MSSPRHTHSTSTPLPSSTANIELSCAVSTSPAAVTVRSPVTSSTPMTSSTVTSSSTQPPQSSSLTRSQSSHVLSGIVDRLVVVTDDDTLSSALSLPFEDSCLWRDAFSTLYEFYQTGTFCDVEIHVGSQRVNCHRLVLACFSKYFRSMFTSEMSECHSRTVTIHDVDETAFVALVEFAYTARITLTTDNVQTLLYACSILQIESVARACCKFMASHLHPSNCIGVRNFAQLHGHTELVSSADEFILDNFTAVAASDEFHEMTAHNLLTVIASSHLNVRSEVEVYEAVMCWIKSNVADNSQYVSSLVSELRLAQLPTAYLLSVVCSEELIRRDTVCRDHVDTAKDYQMMSHAQLLLAAAHTAATAGLFTVTSSLTDRRRVLLPRHSYAGILFCVGGRGTSGTPFKTIECYDARKNAWVQVIEMSTRRRHVGVVAVAGKLYAVGGHDGNEHLKSGEVFDPVTNKWQSIAPMSKLRRGIALAHLNGPIYAVGGLDDSACFNIVERYDAESDCWTIVQSMNSARGGVAVTAFRGYLYAIGGNNGVASLDTCERYDPHLNKWTLIEPMKKRRAGAGVAQLHGHLYVVGGFDDNAPLDCVERYDPVQNVWSTVVSMSCPRGGVGVAALGGKLYAVGGHDGSNYLSSVEEYDPSSDRWQNVAHIGTCRAGAGVAVVECHADDLKDSSKLTQTAVTGSSCL